MSAAALLAATAAMFLGAVLVWANIGYLRPLCWYIACGQFHELVLYLPQRSSLAAARESLLLLQRDFLGRQPLWQTQAVAAAVSLLRACDQLAG